MQRENKNQSRRLELLIGIALSMQRMQPDAWLLILALRVAAATFVSGETPQWLRHCPSLACSRDEPLSAQWSAHQ